MPWRLRMEMKLLASTSVLFWVVVPDFVGELEGIGEFGLTIAIGIFIIPGRVLPRISAVQSDLFRFKRGPSYDFTEA